MSVFYDWDTFLVDVIKFWFFAPISIIGGVVLLAILGDCIRALSKTKSSSPSAVGKLLDSIFERKDFVPLAVFYYSSTAILALLFFQITFFLKFGVWHPSTFGSFSPESVISVLQSIAQEDWKGISKAQLFLIVHVPLYVYLMILAVGAGVIVKLNRDFLRGAARRAD